MMVVRQVPVVAVSRILKVLPSRYRVPLLIVDPDTVFLSRCEMKKEHVHQSCQGLGKNGVHSPESQGCSRVV